MTYEEVYEDMMFLQDTFGYVYDYCGGYCNNDVLDSMLKNPSKTNAKNHMIDLIDRYFRVGFGDTFGSEALDLNDHRVYEIAKKYGMLE